MGDDADVEREGSRIDLLQRRDRGEQLGDRRGIEANVSRAWDLPCAARVPVRRFEHDGTGNLDPNHARERIGRREVGQLVFECLDVHRGSLGNAAVERALDDGAGAARHPAVLVAQACLRTMNEPEHAPERLGPVAVDRE